MHRTKTFAPILSSYEGIICRPNGEEEWLEGLISLPTNTWHLSIVLRQTLLKKKKRKVCIDCFCNFTFDPKQPGRQTLSKGENQDGSRGLRGGRRWKMLHFCFLAPRRAFTSVALSSQSGKTDCSHSLPLQTSDCLSLFLSVFSLCVCLSLPHSVSYSFPPSLPLSLSLTLSLKSFLLRGIQSP